MGLLCNLGHHLCLMIHLHQQLQKVQYSVGPTGPIVPVSPGAPAGPVGPAGPVAPTVPKRKDIHILIPLYYAMWILYMLGILIVNQLWHAITSKLTFNDRTTSYTDGRGDIICNCIEWGEVNNQPVVLIQHMQAARPIRYPKFKESRNFFRKIKEKSRNFF